MYVSRRLVGIDVVLFLLHYFSLRCPSLPPSQVPLQVLDTSSGLLFSGYLNETTLYLTYPDCPYNATQFNSVTFVYFTLFYRIENIAVWKVPLFEWLPTDFGIFYHAYLVLETIDTYGEFHYWSFEKNSNFLILQQTPWATHRNVVDYIHGKPRLRGKYWKPTLLLEEEFIIAASTLFNFYKSAEMQRHYHQYDLMFLNCKHFAQEMFNLLTHKEKWDCSIETVLLQFYDHVISTENIFSSVLWASSSLLMWSCVRLRFRTAVFISLLLVVVLQCGCGRKEEVDSSVTGWKRKYVTVQKWKPKLKKYIDIEP